MNRNENSDDDTEEPEQLSHVQKMAKKFEQLGQAQCEPEPVACPKRNWQYQQRNHIAHTEEPPDVADEEDAIAEDMEAESEHDDEEANAEEFEANSHNPDIYSHQAAATHAIDEYQGRSRVLWLAQKFELMALASKRSSVSSRRSSRHSDSANNTYDEKIVSLGASPIANCSDDETQPNDEQQPNDTTTNQEHESRIADICEKRSYSSMSEASSINEESDQSESSASSIVNIVVVQGETNARAVREVLSDHDAVEDEPTETVQFKNKSAVQSNIESHHDDADMSEYEDFSDSTEFSDSGDDDDGEHDEPEPEQFSLPVRESQVPHIIEELLSNELFYIQTLAKGIENYIGIFDLDTLPALMHGQKYHIFGNIERIKEFHETVFQPSLQDCGTDVERICETFCDFIQKDYFYPYILYAINRKRSERLCMKNRSFLQERQTQTEDKLGFNSFFVQPIQRLPKYQLLLSNLIKELGRQLVVDGVKDKIAACCRAEKHIQRLLDRLNDSMSINDIEDCVEVKLLYQGKFLFLHEFEIADVDLRRRYRGKVFFFEKCIVHTETLDKTRLAFRGHYLYTDIGIAFEEGKPKFFLYHKKRGNKEIECASDPKTIQFWTDKLGEMMRKSVEVRKQRSANNRDSGISDISAAPQYVMVRNSVMSIPNSNSSSGTSTAWTSGLSSTSSGSYESDSRRTTWYTNTDANLVSNGKTLERLLNSEKHYILIMSTYMKTYLMKIADLDKVHQISGYIDTAGRIIEYHKLQHYPSLKDCNRNIIDICAVFRSSLRNDEFIEAYQLYAALSYRSYQVLDEVFKETHADISSYTNIPVEHLNRCHTFLEHLMIELKDADDTFVSDEFKAVAVTEVLFNKFRNRVLDNLRLNSMKGSTKNIVDEYGLVEHSEPVAIYGKEHRLLLLQRGLVCVKSRISMKTNREKFTELVFWIPLSAVRTIESNHNPARLKFFASYAKQIIFKLDFATKNVKESIQSKVNVFRNMSV